jgi:hypothetical protein
VPDPFWEAIVYKATDPASASYNNTVVIWDSELIDVNGSHSTSSNTSRFTIPSALNGKYGVLHGQIEFSNTGLGGTFYIYLAKVGSPDFDGAGICFHTTTQDWGWVQVESQPMLLATADYFELIAYNDHGAIIQSENSQWSLEIVG